MRPYKQCERDRIARMVKAAAYALRPDLEYLFYALEEDHSGEPAIFFRMVLSDRLGDCSRRQHFDRIREMEESIRMIVEPEEYGLHSYFNLRSLSACRKVKDREWPVPIEEECSNVR